MKYPICLAMLTGFFLFVVCSSACSQNMESLGQNEIFINQVDSMVSNKMNEYDIPGLSIGIVVNDTIICAKGYGLTNVGGAKKVTGNSIFHTASISKLFTAQAIMLCMSENGLTYDQKLIDLIPDLRYKDERIKNITIKQVLNHTAGLPDISNYHWENHHQADESLKEYVSGLDLKLETDPGIEFQYSNLGYDILGYVIERLSGLTFDAYLKENILIPAGMVNSDFRYFIIPDSLKVSPHTASRLTGNISVRKVYPYTREHAPSSTLNASAIELSKWMVYFLDQLSDLRYQELIESSVASFSHIGLGFQLGELEGFKKVGHYGGDRGFRSYLMMIPEKKIGLVVLGNCDYREDFRQEILHPIATLLLK